MVYRNGYISVVKDFNVLRLTYNRTVFNNFTKIYKNISEQKAIELFKKEINNQGF